jgi:proteasome accessory factor A
VNPLLTLDDPVAAFLRWSHDPTLRARMPTTSGWPVTALELQMRYLEEAEAFVRSDQYAGTVPDEGRILALWRETLELLREGDLAALARRLDWALKLTMLRRARDRRPGLDFPSPELKHLDQVYGSLDPEEGLYLSAERAGLVERLVSGEEIGRFATSPPEDTRAWTRAMLLRRAGARRVEDVDWDRIRLRITRADGFPVQRTFEMPDPGGLTRKEAGGAFERSRSLEELLDRLETLPGSRGTGPRARPVLRALPASGPAETGPALVAGSSESKAARCCAAGSGEGDDHGNQGT